MREKENKKWWVPRLEGRWRASKNGGWEGEFEGVCKMKVCLEALLELGFCTKPPNFGVETHMEAPTLLLLHVRQPQGNNQLELGGVLLQHAGGQAGVRVPAAGRE
jgi:hypothetical protein